MSDMKQQYDVLNCLYAYLYLSVNVITYSSVASSRSNSRKQLSETHFSATFTHVDILKL